VKIIDYMVVWATNLDTLAVQVRSNLPEWQPFGSMHSEMFFEDDGRQCKLLQPMVKYEEELPRPIFAPAFPEVDK